MERKQKEEREREREKARQGKRFRKRFENVYRVYRWYGGVQIVRLAISDGNTKVAFNPYSF